MKLGWRQLARKRTVIGAVLTAIGALLGKGSVNLADVVTAVGAIVAVAGARSAVSEGKPAPAPPASPEA